MSSSIKVTRLVGTLGDVLSTGTNDKGTAVVERWLCVRRTDADGKAHDMNVLLNTYGDTATRLAEFETNSQVLVQGYIQQAPTLWLDDAGQPTVPVTCVVVRHFDWLALDDSANDTFQVNIIANAGGASVPMPTSSGEARARFSIATDFYVDGVASPALWITVFCSNQSATNTATKRVGKGTTVNVDGTFSCTYNAFTNKDGVVVTSAQCGVNTWYVNVVGGNKPAATAQEAQATRTFTRTATAAVKSNPVYAAAAADIGDGADIPF